MNKHDSIIRRMIAVCIITAIIIVVLEFFYLINMEEHHQVWHQHHDPCTLPECDDGRDMYCYSDSELECAP